MRIRLALLAVLALFTCVALAPAASAQSGVDQYLEEVPDAGGKGPADDAQGGSENLPKGEGENASAAAPPDDGDDGGGISGVVIAVIAIVLLGPIALLLYRRFSGNGRGGEPEQA